jgi:hypothetical protein
MTPDRPGGWWGPTWAGRSASCISVRCPAAIGAVQVVASSGIRTTVAESKPFAVPLTPRKATILSAEASASGQVVLRGGAFSPDFGLGAPEDVTWSSNVDGLLGYGFMLVADRLTTEGLHVITLAAPDGLGDLATASTSVTVTLPNG